MTMPTIDEGEYAELVAETAPGGSPARVLYGRVINLGNYENERYSISFDVEAGETPAEAMARARAFVDEQRALQNVKQRQIERLESLEGAIEQMKGKIRKMHAGHVKMAADYEKMRALLLQYGASPDRVPPIQAWNIGPWSEATIARLFGDDAAAEPDADDLGDDRDRDDDDDDDDDEL